MSKSWQSKGSVSQPDSSASQRQDGQRSYGRGQNESTIEQSRPSIPSPPTIDEAERRTLAALHQASSARYGADVFRSSETASRAGNLGLATYGISSTPTRLVPQASSSGVILSNQTSVPSTISKGKDIFRILNVETIRRSRIDAASGVKSTAITGLPQNITAPELQEFSIYVSKSLEESQNIKNGKRDSKDDEGDDDDDDDPNNEDGDSDKGKARKRGKDQDRRKGRRPRRDKSESNKRDKFKFGNVIELLWIEPFDNATTLTHFANDVGFSRTRRFVVIRQGQDYSALLPISTYDSRGVSARGIVKAHHAIIFTTRGVPRLLPGEEPTRTGSGVDSLRREIKVRPYDRARKLDECSRLNFAKVYQINHAKCEVNIFGTVADESMPHLHYQFNDVQRSLPRSYPYAQDNQVMGQRQQVDVPRQQQSHILGQAGPSHVRVDSAQQHRTPQESFKPPGRNVTSNDDNDDEDNKEDDCDNQRKRPQQPIQSSMSPASAQTLSLQMAALNLRARNVGANLTNLTDHERIALAQQSAEGQSRAMLAILQRQNPLRYQQVLLQLQQRQKAAAAAMSQTRRQADDIEQEEDSSSSSSDEDDEESE